MSPRVLRLAEVLAVLTAFGTAIAVIVLGFRIALNKTRQSPAVGGTHGGTIDESRFARLEQAVDAIAIEVERIAEAQRFSAKLMSERLPERLPDRSATSNEARR